MKKSLFAVLAFICCLTGKAQTADEVIGKYISATGGSKWKDIKSYQIDGKVSTPQGEIPIMVYAKEKNKNKVSLLIQDQEFVMSAFDGTTGWYKNPMQGGNVPTKMGDAQIKELSLDEFEDEFIDYKKKGHAISLEGQEEINGTKCFKIKLVKHKSTEKDDVTEYHYIDAKNYIPVLLKTFVLSGPSKGTEMKTYLSDFKDVEGVKMPFLVEQKMGDQSMGKVTVIKYTLNQVEDSIFQFPQ